MRITLSTLAALLVSVSAVDAAHADDVVASGDDHALFIERISQDQIQTVYQEPRADADTLGALAWVWSDAQTLWVLRTQGDAKLAVAKIVDRRVEPAREITLADFKLKREPVPIPYRARPFEAPVDGTVHPDLLVTKSGQVWLARCLAYIKFAECRMGYLRLDKPAPLATRPPANVNNTEPEFPAISAPAGYIAVLKTAKARGLTFRGATCKGPHGDWVSAALYEVTPPDNANYLDENNLKEWALVEVTKIDWVRAAPPVMRYFVKKRSQTWAQYLEDCQDVVPAPILIDDGRWIDRALVRRADGSELGSLHGQDRVVVAPKP
jgi:hypothetical protein